MILYKLKKFTELNLKTKQIFNKIYSEKLWTPDKQKKLFSILFRIRFS